jgi:hypothetical protein
LVVSVMNERLQRLAPSANQPNGSLQTLAFDGAHTVCGELSAIIRFEPDRKAACQAAVSIRHSRSDFLLHGGKETHPQRMTRRMPVKALHGLRRCQELTPKTTESHRSGGQRDP